MAYKLFNGVDASLGTTNQDTIKEFLKVVEEIKYPIGDNTKRAIENGNMFGDFYEFYGVNGYSSNICRYSRITNPKSLNEFVTELYKWKKANQDGV